MKLINVKPKSTRCSVGHSLQKALKPRKKLGAHGKKKTLKQLYIAHVKKKAAESLEVTKFPRPSLRPWWRFDFWNHHQTPLQSICISSQTMGLFSCKFLFREMPAFGKQGNCSWVSSGATFYGILQKMLCPNDLKTGVSCLVLADLRFKMWRERGAFIF